MSRAQVKNWIKSTYTTDEMAIRSSRNGGMIWPMEVVAIADGDPFPYGARAAVGSMP